MDFLKNLADQPKADSKQQQHTNPHGSDSEKMIDKITEAFEGLSHDKPAPKIPAAHTAGGGGGLLDKISGTFEGHQNPAEKTRKDEGGLIDKISGAIGGHQKPLETHQDEGGLMDKISGAIGGHQKPLETHKDEGGLMDKISGAIGGHQKPLETHKDEGGLMDKISGAIGGHQKPAQEGGIMGHINNALGGGQAGEKKEDALDKAVDMFQEHILRQGPQNNESAFEQAQDRAIADSIKHQFENITGKHFSGKDK